jgi:SAM-dependent methyltransferase
MGLEFGMPIPRMILDCANLPGVRAVPIWVCDQRFRLWKKRHPEGSFAEFYVADAERKLSKGRHHSTLGARGWANRGSSEIDWDSVSFAGRGLVNWRQIVDLGLQPDMRCVDFGCGSLRLGQHAIRYLAPSNYWGVDLTASFIDAGLRLLPPELIASNTPRFGVIDDALLAEIRAWEPDFIFANAVLQHVPPDELSVFFRRIAAIMAPSTRAYVLFVSDARVRRIKSVTWAYPAALLEGIARAAVPGALVRTIDVAAAYEQIVGGRRKILCIEGLGGDVGNVNRI